MKLTVLGSIGGYPEPGRACSGYLVRSGHTALWVDAGAGTLDALLRILPLESLDGILISHLHADHWTDLPIALHQLAVTGARNPAAPIPVYGPPEWTRMTGVSAQWFYPGSTHLPSHEIEDDMKLQLGDIEIIFRAVEHGMPAFAMRFSDGSNTIAYSADSSPCEALVDIAQGVDLFLCEATLPSGSMAAISMNPEQAGEIASKARARRLVLTHLLPGIDPEDSCSTASRWFDGGVVHADPGTTFELDEPNVGH